MAASKENAFDQQLPAVVGAALQWQAWLLYQSFNMAGDGQMRWPAGLLVLVQLVYCRQQAQLPLSRPHQSSGPSQLSFPCS